MKLELHGSYMTNLRLDGATRYCFDSSAFINSWRRHYPIKSFRPLWDKFDELIRDDRLIMPKEAAKEILNGNDELIKWFKEHIGCVRPYTVEQIQIVSEIVNKYPKVSHYSKVKPVHADPFVVALAKTENIVVITYEKYGGSKENPSIGALCQEFKVDCDSMIGFFERENLSFQLS